MAQAARVHRAAFDERLPWLSGLHTPQEDTAFFAGHVFDTCQVWGAWDGDKLLGFAAARDNWLDHLYVAPASQSLGVGSELLEACRQGRSELLLWTFQRNILARRFYERRGFKAVRETDGSGNEEREPDVLYEWRALTGPA